MSGGMPRRLLGPTVGAAAVLAGLAIVIWAIALWVSWGGACPQWSHASAGLDRGISIWPPAGRCVGSHGVAFWHQALPWATWLAGALVAVAAAVLLTGLVVSIRDLRRPRPVASGSPSTLATE